MHTSYQQVSPVLLIQSGSLRNLLRNLQPYSAVCAGTQVVETLVALSADSPW